MSQVYIGNSSQVSPTEDLHVARFIVSPGGAADGANYTDLPTAYAAAIAKGGDQTVFLQPGTYSVGTMALANGVDIAAFNSDAFEPSAIILGQLTANFSGACSISGVELQTNNNFFLNISGSSATVVNLLGCYLNCLNNTGISFTSSNGSSNLNISYCGGNIANSSSTLFSQNSAGTMLIEYCDIQNLIQSTTVSTWAAGNLVIRYCRIGFLISISGTTGGLQAFYTFFQGVPGNVCLAISSTAGIGATIDYCYLSSTSVTAVISIGAGATANIRNTSLFSNATEVITGSGTLNFVNLSFIGGSSGVNVTTQNALISIPGGVQVTIPGSFPYTTMGTDYVIAVNTSSTANTVTLLASPQAGQSYRIKDKSANASAHNITISGNGINIIGTSSASTYVINTNGGSVDLVYDSVDNIWLVV